VGDLDRLVESAEAVDLDALKSVGLAPKKAKFLKILGWGKIEKAVNVTAHAVSRGAREKIEAASGTVKLIPTQAPRRPKGVKKPRPAAGSEGAGP
ncbi:MAG: uL15 family ribosomal protein, partial [Planctomycetota bacterium]|jgi:large subunit ribosomal protein L15